VVERLEALDERIGKKELQLLGRAQRASRWNIHRHQEHATYDEQQEYTYQ
jgi:hypothetical protein